jgi:hypothetical protein
MFAYESWKSGGSAESRSESVATEGWNKILEIRYPDGGKLRARTVVSRSRARCTIKYPSWKMGRMIEAESEPEMNAFRLLDVDPTVTAFYEQPLRVRYRLDGTEHAHYPDILVERLTGPMCERRQTKELWEVKTCANAADPEVEARTRFLESVLPQHGYEYRLVLAEDVAGQPRLTNCVALLDNGQEPVSLVERELVRQLLEAMGFISWESAMRGDLGRRGRAVLSRLTLEGYLTFDVERPLAPASRFRLARPESWSERSPL